MSLNDSTSNGLGKRSKWTAVRTKALLIHSEKLIQATDWQWDFSRSHDGKEHKMVIDMKQNYMPEQRKWWFHRFKKESGSFSSS